MINFIKELNLWCEDHFNHFGFYPVEFEYEGVVYNDEVFWPLINFKKINRRNI
tara:strand:- start:867 stop:1025 length:159 start_codon:yes stop_codon:yes gene_type:complete